ncbi:uncharacterized protein LOC111707859 [Eurytemora carolleeae]|uniref:uncharacterized protein LOC111707859 n=1 Tax=Eurytemora carolleeae TaxID=1294199 RepID=UPI000C786367|nr:uncharacterized protein LOC111707859 [Eurytemora carolleeae]|eukprot:XP_023336807.1 uncharacterized protein LOC111707859 [Eurytemora affinis]
MDSITVTTKTPNCHMVGFETVDTKLKGSWTVIQKSADAESKDVLVRSDLAAKIMSTVGVTKAEHKLPFFPLIFSDNKMTVFDNDPLYTSLPSDRKLDEVHLKVVMKSLARLHAISFIFFKRSNDENSKALLSDSAFTEENRATTTKLLENRLDRVLTTLAAEGCSEEEIKMVKTLKNSLYNIYKEAATSNSLLPVLCHGEPTPANIKFKYAADGLPIDARFVNLEKCRYGSGVNDIHLFINSSGNNTAREDFLLRFVYYEALVSLLKVYGEKNVFSFDELKSEFVQKRLYGYIQSSFILAEGHGTGHVSKKTVSAPVVQSQQGTKAVESKILGKFFPGRAKVAAVAKFNQVEKGSVMDKEDVGSRVRDIIMKAMKV